MLIEKITKDYLQARKERDALRISVLSMLKSSVKYLEIENREKPLTDEDVVALIKREIKKHEESIEMYKAGEREDLVHKEEAELKILKEYLPEGLNEEQVRNIIKNTVNKLNAKGEKDFGRVMKEIMPLLKGKADGSLIKKIVEEILKGE